MSSTTAAPNLCHSASVQALLLSTMRLLYDAHMFADKLTVVWRSCVPCTCGHTRSRRGSYRRVSLAQRWSVEEQRACAAGFSRPPPARSCGSLLRAYFGFQPDTLSVGVGFCHRCTEYLRSTDIRGRSFLGTARPAADVLRLPVCVSKRTLRILSDIG